MYQNLHFGRRVVFYFLGFYLTFLYGLRYRVDERGRCFTERNLLDDERLVVEFLYARPYLEHASALSVVVFAGVYAATRSEEHTSELQSRQYLVCRLLLEKTHTVITKVLTSTYALEGVRPPRSRLRSP